MSWEPEFRRVRPRPRWSFVALMVGAALVLGWQQWTRLGARRTAPARPARVHIVQALGPDSRAAFLTLIEADLVVDRAVEGRFARPAVVAAFDRLTGERIASFAFRELVLTAAPPGQVYGLCGLYRLRSPTFFLAQAHLFHEPSVPVRLQTVRDLYEDVETHAVASRPLEVCRQLVPAGEKLPEDPAELQAP